MASKKPDMPRTQTSAPVKPPRTTEDATGRRRDPDEGEWPSRGAGDPGGDHGDRMPRGADEPGAGL
jgi:hypothetical protein